VKDSGVKIDEVERGGKIEQGREYRFEPFTRNHFLIGMSELL